MSNKIIDASNYVVKVVRQILHEQEVEPIQEGASFTYKDVYSIAKFHQIENLVFFGIEKYIDDPKLLEYWTKKNKQNITQTLVQEEEKKILAEEFEKNNIDFCPVKGYYDRFLYPRPDFRFMSDLDILFDVKKQSTSKKLMKKLGYTCDTYNYGKDDTYTKKPFVHVELHRSLVMSYDKNYQYYEKIYQKATISPTNKNHYILNADDLYLFDIEHLKRHFEESGAGLRNFIDIYLILTKKANELHKDYLDEESKKLGFTDFRNKVEKIALEWFGTGVETDELKEMKEYIFSSGIYGTNSNSIDHHLNDKKESKAKIIFRRAFPPVHEFKGYYPILQKWIILLPFCYMHRLLRVFKYHKRIAGEIKEIKNK